MSEKEIVELIAGLNPEALEAFRMYMVYVYVKLFVESGVLLGVFLGGGWMIAKGVKKMVEMA